MSKAGNMMSRVIGRSYGHNERSLTSVLSAFCSPSPPLSTEASEDELEEFRLNVIKFLPNGKTAITDFYEYFEDDLAALESLISVTQNFSAGQLASLRVAILYAASCVALATPEYTTLPELTESYSYVDVMSRISDPTGEITGERQNGDLFYFPGKLNRVQQNHYESKPVVFSSIDHVPEGRKYEDVVDPHGEMHLYVCPRSGAHPFFALMADTYRCTPYTPHDLNPTAASSVAPGEVEDDVPIIQRIQRSVSFSPSTVGEGEGSDPRDELASTISVRNGRNDLQRVDVSRYVAPTAAKAPSKILFAQLERTSPPDNADVKTFSAVYKATLATSQGTPHYETYRSAASVYRLAGEQLTIDSLKSAIDTTFNRDQALESILKHACAERNISSSQHCSSVQTACRNYYQNTIGKQIHASSKVNLAQLLAMLSLATEEACDAMNFPTVAAHCTYLVVAKNVLSTIRSYKRKHVDFRHGDIVLSSIVYESPC